jgi:N utilization substance protein A
MKNEFSLAFNEVLEEKQLPKEIILQAIESAMVSAYRRAVNASTNQRVEAKVDSDTGKVMVLAEKEVVDEVQDERTEVQLENARAVNSEANIGDLVMVDSTPADFGRIAAQTARQVIQQRIREAERQVQSQYFEKQIGEIISGVVQATSNTQGVTVGLDMKAEGIMPPSQKIPGEHFKVHDRMRAIVLEVKESPRGPQIILSRSHRNFLRRLLENEVPEIYHGVVEIRAISREPGQRAKVAVSATQPNVDPVGACVGMRGVRIQAIVKELHDEKIDIIGWNPDPVIYIIKAISPARVSGVYLSEPDKTATVVVQEEELSLAIGRDGQNARLAAKLTGWRIDIKSLPEATTDALAKLQSDITLSALAEAERGHIATIEAILIKKDEGRPVTPEEYTLLAQFVDRIERRTVEQKNAERIAAEERAAAARAGVPPAAFEVQVFDLELAEHIVNILTEAEIRTAGDLLVTLKLNRDRILGLAGIGSKSMQSIEAALAKVSFPEPVVEAAPEATPAIAPEAAAVVEAETPIEAPAEAVEVVPASEEQAKVEAAPAEAEAAPVAEGLAAEEVKPLEEIFVLKPDMLKPATVEEEETASDKKKKKKKHSPVELDEKGQNIARKKHKRGGEAWGEEWEE